MNIFSKLTKGFLRLGIGRQLTIAFSLELALLAVVGVFALYSLSQTDASARELDEKWLVGVGHLAQWRTSAVEIRELEIKHSATQDKAYHAEYEDKITAAVKVVSEHAQPYKARALPGEDSDLLAKVEKSWAAYLKSNQNVLALGREKKQSDAAEVSDGASSMAYDESLSALSALTQFNFDNGKLSAARSHATYVRAAAVVGGLLVAALLLGTGMAFLITRGLLGQLGGEPGQAVELAQAVAAGDLSTRITVKAGDTASLMATLQAMQSALTDTVHSVRLGSESVATASSEIADGNMDLSGRTEQQASALQQTAATMDELGVTVRNNAENARQANVLAQSAAVVAEKGGSVVNDVVQTMKGINESSRKIADITSVIDSIAFQTNILALNAAVEAARAGEQGRGFAVVASEVRSLAQRSADAAKQIKSLISTSVTRVEEGSAQADQAGRTMEEIVAAIAQVSTIVGEISSASAEQSAGVLQVSRAVTQMDQATQQNAALVEESAGAAESLKQQASRLVEAVAVFRLAKA